MKKIIGRRELGEEGERREQMRAILVEQKINQLEGQLMNKVKHKPSTPKLHKRANSSTNFQKQPLMYFSIDSESKTSRRAVCENLLITRWENVKSKSTTLRR